VIGIVDYGAGNLASVRHACDRIGHEAVVLSDPASLDGVDRLILPGVGSFHRAMSMLNDHRWPAALRQYAGSGRPLLGICLGMQLLFDCGDEHGPSPGLGLIAGTVKLMTPDDEHKVPHVGWNALDIVKPHPLVAGLKPHVDFYFVHSYHCVPADPSDTLTRTDYGGQFVSGVAHRNIAGFQFHPEKSQPMGLKILENFAGWDGRC
jgi:glutamine amidotransferase